MSSDPHCDVPSYICKECFGCLPVHVWQEMPGIAFICCYCFRLMRGGLASGILHDRLCTKKKLVLGNTGIHNCNCNEFNVEEFVSNCQYAKEELNMGQKLMLQWVWQEDTVPLQ